MFILSCNISFAIIKVNLKQQQKKTLIFFGGGVSRTSTISDYVLSNELVSMSMAMVAEDRQVSFFLPSLSPNLNNDQLPLLKIHNVLSELFSAEGNEVYLRLMKSYLIRGGLALLNYYFF